MRKNAPKLYSTYPKRDQIAIWGQKYATYVSSLFLYLAQDLDLEYDHDHEDLPSRRGFLIWLIFDKIYTFSTRVVQCMCGACAVPGVLVTEIIQSSGFCLSFDNKFKQAASIGDLKDNKGQKQVELQLPRVYSCTQSQIVKLTHRLTLLTPECQPI